jgi:hypothetical protein
VPPMGPGVRIATADLALGDGEQAGVGQGDAMDISAPGVEHLFSAVHRRLTRDDPAGGPDRRGTGQIGALLGYQGTEPTAAHLSEGPDRHEGRLASRPPRLVVSRDPTGWPQTVPVWMGGEGPGPGVPPTQPPDHATHVMRVRGTRDERLSRRSDQDVVSVLLVLADERPPLLGQGADDMTGGDRQECLPPCCQPGFGVVAVACRTTAMAAGVVDIGRLPAVVTRSQVPTEGFGPAVDQIGQRPPMTGPPRRPNAVQVVAAIAPQDIRHLWHDRTPEGSEVGHAGVDGGMHNIQGRRREMGVAGRGTLGSGGPAVPEGLAATPRVPAEGSPRSAAASGWRPLWGGHAGAPPL